jgi:VCBS repeat-containing protein
VSQLAQGSTGTGAVAANGVNVVTTALGGTVLMNADGTYTYTAPASLNHSASDSLADSFYYKASDGSSDSAWTKVTVNVTDTAPIAVGDVSMVGNDGLVSGNVITGLGGIGSGADHIGADSTQVSSVLFNGTTYDHFVNGSLTINAAHGSLVINQDGTYQYQATESVSLSAGGGDISSWTDSGVGLLGYYMGEPIFGSSVDPSFQPKYGLFINTPGGGDVGNQVDSNSTTQSEAIALNLNADYVSLDVTFKSIQKNDQVGWKTYDSDHNLVDSGVIENSKNGSGGQKEATFSIESSGPFQYIAFHGTDANDDFNIWSISNALPASGNGGGTDEFTYTIQDADNDISSATLSIVQPITGTESSETLIGGDYTDIIDARGGNDTLFAGLGSDTLIGGQGSDTMSGGEGQNTFVWKSGDDYNSPIDTITDFHQGSGGDVLDLSELLSGESYTAESLDSYLHVSYDTSTNATTIEVDASGGATFHATQSIVLAGVDLTVGGTLNSNQDILTDMINNGNLITD